jgi:hypothetical protein
MAEKQRISAAEPSTLDQAADVGRELAGGIVRSAIEGPTMGVEALDKFMPTNPLKLATQAYNLTTGEDATTQDFIRAPQTITERATEDYLQPSIPEEQVTPNLRRAKTAARITGEYIPAFAFPGGLLPKALGTIGGVGGGTAGREFGGEWGEIGGTIAGDILLTNPLGVAKSAARGWEKATEIVSDFWNTKFKRSQTSGGTPSDRLTSESSEEELKTAVVSLLSNMDKRYLTSPDDIDAAASELIDKIKIAVKNGETGTIGQLTGDHGILAFEDEMRRGARTKSADTTQQQVDAANKAAAIDRQLSSSVIDEAAQIAPTGKAERVPSRLNQALAAEEEAIKANRAQQAAELEEQAGTVLTKARAGVGTPETRHREALQAAAPEGVTITESGYAGNRQLDDAVSGAYDAAWKNAPDVDQRVVTDIDEQIKSALDNSTGDEAAVLKNLSADIKRLSQPGTPEQAGAIDRAIRNALESTDSYELTGTLNSIKQMFRGSMPDVADALAPLDAKYPSYLFGKRAGNKADKTGGVPTAQNFETASRSLRSPTAGFRGEGVGQQQVQQSLTADSTMKTAEQQAAALRDSAGKLTDAKIEIDAPGAAPLSKVDAIQETVVKEATTALNSKNAIQRLTDIRNRLADNPEALEDVRRAFMESFINTTTKDGTVTRSGLEDFRRKRKIYEESGIFTPDELDKIDASLAEAQKLYLHDPKYIANLPEERRQLVEILAGVTGAKVGQLILGSPLIGAAYGRKVADKALDKLTTQHIRNLTYRMTTHPEEFADVMNRLQQSNITQTEVNEILRELFTSAVRGAYVGATQE